MRLTSILSGNGFVMYNKELARLVSANGAIIFGQLCSSYESFESKNMLINIDGKEHFFLTAEVIQNETSLSYRQQTSAIKELENFGLIKTKLRGVPAKKHFYITDKINDLFMSNSSSNKNAELENDKLVSYDKRAKQEITKEQNKNVHNVSTIKENNKEKKKERNIVNKVFTNNQEISDKLILEYMSKDLSKEVCLRVLKEVEQTENIENFGAYFRTCLENTLYKSKLKRGKIKHIFNKDSVYYNWLED